ncbi:hypothetical protein BJX65DRAFT_287212 [Aspergillus insuetus]
MILSAIPLTIMTLALSTLGHAQDTDSGYAVVPSLNLTVLRTSSSECLDNYGRLEPLVASEECGLLYPNGQGGIEGGYAGDAWLTLETLENGDRVLGLVESEQQLASLRWLYNASRPSTSGRFYYDLCLADGEGLECVHGPRWVHSRDRFFIAPYTGDGGDPGIFGITLQVLYAEEEE